MQFLIAILLLRDAKFANTRLRCILLKFLPLSYKIPGERALLFFQSNLLLQKHGGFLAVTLEIGLARVSKTAQPNAKFIFHSPLDFFIRYFFQSGRKESLCILDLFKVILVFLFFHDAH